MNSLGRVPSRRSAVLRARSRVVFPLLLLVAALAFPSPSAAQETPYFVAYSHHLEEPGNLEVETYSIYGTQNAGADFIAPWV